MRTNLANIASYGITTEGQRKRAIAKRREHLAGLGIAPPSGTTIADLRRDLSEGKRVAVEAGFVTEIRKVDKRDRLMEFICSTEGQKRDGNVVRAAGFRFGNFDRNPVGTWVHRYDIFPVSRWVERSVQKVNGAPSLVMTAQFVPPDADDGMGEKVFKLYQYGFLNAVSIGWEPIKYRELRGKDGLWGGYEFLEQDLLECAHVLIPADPDALARACRRGVMSSDEVTAFARWAEIDRQSAYVVAWQEKDPPPVRGAMPPVDEDEEDEEDEEEAEGEEDSEGAVPSADDPEVAPDGKAAPVGDVEEKRCPDAACKNGCKNKGNRAACPVQMLRTIRTGAMKRGALSDALDGPCDRLRADGWLFWERVQEIQNQINSLFYFAERADDGPMAMMPGSRDGLIADIRMSIERERRRLQAVSASIDAAIGELGDVLASVEPDTFEGAPAVTPNPVVQAAAKAQADRLVEMRKWLARIGKKIARSRLERLNASYDGSIAASALLREVIDEALEEAQSKVAASGVMPPAEGEQPPAEGEQPAEGEEPAEGEQPEGEEEQPAEGEQPFPPKKAAEGEEAQPAEGEEEAPAEEEEDEEEGAKKPFPPKKKMAASHDRTVAAIDAVLARAERGDDLIAEIEGLVRSDTGGTRRKADAAARAILAGLLDSE